MEETLNASWTEKNPARLIGDKAYDSDAHDKKLKEEYGIELISPNRSNIKGCRKAQDGRVLRRYKRRWKIERINAWLQNFRRITTRWEYKSVNYLGFVLLACMVIILRSLDF